MAATRISAHPEALSKTRDNASTLLTLRREARTDKCRYARRHHCGWSRHGSLDPSFGTAGRVITDFGMRDDFAFSVAVHPNGKIVVAGTSGFVTGSSQNDFALARYERDGNLGQSFGAGGMTPRPILGPVSSTARLLSTKLLILFHRFVRVI